MMVVVSYDVGQDEGGQKRLRKMAKLCEGFGQRVQYSVFECLVDPAQSVNLKAHTTRSSSRSTLGAVFFPAVHWEQHGQSLADPSSA